MQITPFVSELVPSNRKLVEFSLEFQKEAAKAPGCLAKAIVILAGHNVNILTGFHHGEIWSFFADITEIDSSVDDIVKELSSLATINKVQLGNEVSEGAIVDTLHQRLTWGPFRMIMISAEVMSAIFDRIKGIFGAEGKAGRALVYGMGETAGRSFYKVLASEMGADRTKSHVEDLIKMHNAQGWGDFRLASLDLNRRTALVTVADCFECAANEASSHSSCDFVLGRLAGIFSEMFGERMQATETSCVSLGHVRCTFEIAPF